MVIPKTFELNGVAHIRHYSNRGLMIASDDGVEYEVAEDLASLGKVYHETETPVPQDDVKAAEILDIILGGAT
jgi:hypothetical protein